MVEVNVFTPPDRDEPWLGLATTRELLLELASRMRGQNSIAGEDLGHMCEEAVKHMDDWVLNYRTVDS